MSIFKHFLIGDHFWPLNEPWEPVDCSSYLTIGAGLLQATLDTPGWLGSTGTTSRGAAGAGEGGGGGGGGTRTAALRLRPPVQVASPNVELQLAVGHAGVHPPSLQAQPGQEDQQQHPAAPQSSVLDLTSFLPSLHFFQIFFSSSISRQTSISLPMHLIWLLNLKFFLSFQYHFIYCLIIILWCILLIRDT